MKLLDKFLKFLKTDRNTFFSYILTLLTVYILVDRITECLLIVFTGVAFNYWGPIKYTFAFFVPIFAFLFVYPSKFITCDDDKLGWFYAFCVSLGTLAMTMILEWINKLAWLGIISLPNYVYFASNFSYLIKPALSSIAVAIPLVTWYKLFAFIYSGVNDSKQKKDSIFDFDGISLSGKKPGTGTYSDEIYVGIDKDHGHSVKLPELRRFEHTMVVGISGVGKTSLILEPWIAQDISKKSFYRQASKNLAFASLKAGLCSLDAPYSNDYINKNFSLNMVEANESRKNIFKSYTKKLVMNSSGSKTVYKNLGITYVAPDVETVDRIIQVCDNYQMDYDYIDPENSHSLGLNPFTFDDPTQTALCISTVLKGFYSDRVQDNADAYKDNLSLQIIENLAVLLKVAYPKLNDGKLPNIDDMLKLLGNFDLIEKLCKILENDKELAKRYENELIYFKKNFYYNSPNRDMMQQAVAIPMAQLDTLLRYPGVKQILCNRTNNINFDRSLAEGKITIVCTRRGDLGENAHKAFGLFFLLLMQYSVLRRPGSENTRIPNYLYIDEFPDFICPAIEPIFTVYRKYRVGTVITAQNLSQLRARGTHLADTIIANCSNKIVFGGNSPEDNEWWGKEIGDDKKWYVDNDQYHTKTGTYDEKVKAVYGNRQKYSPGKIQSLKFKRAIYKLKDLKGKINSGQVNLDFMPSKYKEKQSIKNYDFSNFSNGIAAGNKKDGKSSLLNLARAHFDEHIDPNEGPIKTDPSNLAFGENSDEAIVTSKLGDSKKSTNS